MTTQDWESVWTRAREGADTLVRADHLPPSPTDLKLVVVDCRAAVAGGVLEDACRRVERLLGAAHDSPSGGRPRGLRHGLLGELPEQSAESRFVELCNRLAEWSAGHAALALESLEAADPPTLESLKDILDHRGWLRLPLILVVGETPAGRVAQLVQVLQDRDPEAVIAPPARPPQAGPFDWQGLPDPGLRVLRAAAVVGTTFEAELVARLLEESPGRVLEALQQAADAGAPLADRGEGRFSLPPEGVTALQARLLPSLAAYWHHRLARLLGGAEAGTSRPAAAAAPAPDKAPTRGAGEGAAPEPAPVAEGGPRPVPFGELLEPSTSTAVATEQPEPYREAVAMPAPPRSAGSGGDPAQAAAHLDAAGEVEDAARHYLEAIRELEARNDVRRGYYLTEQALELLEGLPPSRSRALLAAQLWLERGRLQWQGTVAGAPFTLDQALESLESARRLLADQAPAEVLGELATVTAGVCYDRGDMASLERALEQLTQASRALLEGGDPLAAARLLNEQAAVWVRLGDPVRASHLLTRARELFGDRLVDSPDDLPAWLELAETEHLLARLPLHARSRPGRELEALSLGLEHARGAERTYRRLGRQREMARVWETQGRLELMGNRRDAARRHFAEALKVQKAEGDMTGLARTTAALADLLAGEGELEAAAGVLGDSVALNRQKGSPIGLAFNRRALAALLEAARRSPHDPGLQDALAQVEERLSEAEGLLGRLVLPGESD